MATKTARTKHKPTPAGNAAANATTKAIVRLIGKLRDAEAFKEGTWREGYITACDDTLAEIRLYRKRCAARAGGVGRK